MNGEAAAPILVTGGTGTLGQLVAARLRDDGHPVRVLSRHARPVGAAVEHVAADLRTGDGVAAALRAVETVVHCAGSNTGDDVMASNLVAAALRSGVRHVVNISVIGAERVPVIGGVDRAMFGYFASKRRAERVFERSQVPWTTLRAAQFHELVLNVARFLSRSPVVPLPSGFRFQPVAAAEVAARLVELALAPPAEYAADIAGPAPRGADDLFRAYLAAAQVRRAILPVRLPGHAANAIRAGANLPIDGVRGRQTWEAFLGERVSTPR